MANKQPTYREGIVLKLVGYRNDHNLSWRQPEWPEEVKLDVN